MFQTSNLQADYSRALANLKRSFGNESFRKQNNISNTQLIKFLPKWIEFQRLSCFNRNSQFLIHTVCKINDRGDQQILSKLIENQSYLRLQNLSSITLQTPIRQIVFEEGSDRIYFEQQLNLEGPSVYNLFGTNTNHLSIEKSPNVTRYSEKKIFDQINHSIVLAECLFNFSLIALDKIKENSRNLQLINLIFVYQVLKMMKQRKENQKSVKTGSTVKQESPQQSNLKTEPITSNIEQFFIDPKMFKSYSQKQIKKVAKSDQASYISLRQYLQQQKIIKSKEVDLKICINISQKIIDWLRMGLMIVKPLELQAIFVNIQNLSYPIKIQQFHKIQGLWKKYQIQDFINFYKLIYQILFKRKLIIKRQNELQSTFYPNIQLMTKCHSSGFIHLFLKILCLVISESESPESGLHCICILLKEALKTNKSPDLKEHLKSYRV